MGKLPRTFDIQTLQVDSVEVRPFRMICEGFTKETLYKPSEKVELLPRQPTESEYRECVGVGP